MKKGKSKEPKEIILPEDVAESYRFSYDLTYDEAYRAFSLLAFKRSSKFRLIAGIILTAAAVLMLVLFAMDNTKVMDLFLAVIAILLLSGVIVKDTKRFINDLDGWDDTPIPVIDDDSANDRNIDVTLVK